MWSTRIFLIGLLLVKVQARPGGYGVKGGRVSKATATAVASAHADASSFGTAKSSASAIASASSNGDGASEAIAHANASADGGNIVRGEPSEKENGHANELGDSDDLRESNDRGKATEYKSINHQDGTAGWNSRNPDAEHVASGAGDVDSIKTEQTHDEPDCSPIGVKGHRGTPTGSAGSGCKNTKPSENPQFPAHNGNTDSSADWQHSSGENGGKILKPGAIDRGHAASPCTPGDSECLLPIPTIFNPRPSYNAHPVVPEDSLKPPGIPASYGQHDEKPDSFGGSPCTCADADSKCQTHNHPHPSYANHPNVPVSSLTPPEITNSYPQPSGIETSHSSSPCAFGDSKCLVQSSTIPSPKPQHQPDSPIGAHKPTGSVSGYGENPENPGMVDRSYAGSPCGYDGSKCLMGKPTASNAEDSLSSCGPGDSNCIGGRPSIPKPHSAFGEKPDSTDMSSHPMDIDGGYGEDNAKPGHPNKHGSPIVSSCGSDSKCASHRPTPFGHHSGGSQHSIDIGSQYGGHSQGPGTITPVYSGHPAPGNHPGTSNPFLNGEIDVSSLKSSSNSGAASGGTFNPLNPFLNPHLQPHNPTGPSNRPSNSNGNTGNPQAGSFADNDHSQVKPNPSNPFLHPHGHGNPTSGVNHPGTISPTQTSPPNKFPSVQAQPGVGSSPNSGCHGSGSCAPHKPSELLPIAPEHPHAGSPPGSGHHGTKPNSPNPFFSHHQGHKDKPADSTYPEANGQHKPNADTEKVNQPSKPINDCLGIASCASTPPPGVVPPKNPFFTHHGPKVETDETAAGHKPGQYPNSHGSSNPHPDPQPSGPNPFLGHGKDHPSDEKPQANDSESGITFDDCNQHNGQETEKNFGSSVTEGLEIDRRQNNYGVKGRRPGVKGGSRGPPMKLQGSSGPGENVDTGSGPSAIAQSSAVASANAFSHASASSSSSAAGAHSSASAKSEAYSMHNSPDGLSSSWASSTAHASAYASSYSSSSRSADGQASATLPEIPAQ